MMMVKTKLKKSPIHGFGIFSDQNIKKGDVVWKYNPIIDKKITPKEYKSLPLLAQKYIDKYGFKDHDKMWVMCGDDARFFNHSIKPSCKEDGVENERDNITTAARDIKKGEELTSNYNHFDYPKMKEKLKKK